MNKIGETTEKNSARGSALLRGLIGIGILICLWYAGSFLIDSPVLPRPHAVLISFINNLFPTIALHFGASLLRVLAAMFASLCIGLPLGIAIGQIPAVGHALDPVISVLYPIPKIVFLPVIYLLVGINNFSKIILITLILVFQILVFVRDAVRNIPEDMVFAARALCAGRLALFRFIYLPAAIPATFAALRVSAGTAVAVLFFAEQSITQYGLGHYIMVKTYQVLRYTEMYAGILAISILGASLYILLSAIEKKLTRYRNP